MSEYSLQASSPLTGKVHRGLAFMPASWLKMKAQNRACPRCVTSAVCMLTCTDWSLRNLGPKMAPSPAQAVRALPGAHISSGREGAWMSGARNRVCPRSCVTSACPRSCVTSAVRTLTCTAWSLWDLGPKMSGQILSGFPFKHY